MYACMHVCMYVYMYVCMYAARKISTLCGNITMSLPVFRVCGNDAVTERSLPQISTLSGNDLSLTGFGVCGNDAVTERSLPPNFMACVCMPVPRGWGIWVIDMTGVLGPHNLS